MAKQAIKLLSLTLDVVFKAFFKGNETLLRYLLESFLPLPEGWTISKIYIMDAELTPQQAKQKRFLLDFKLKVKLKNTKGSKERMVNVEMQTVAHKYIAERFLAYACRIFSDQLPAGESYEEICPVYSLIFTLTNWKVFKKTSDYYHICTLRRTAHPYLLMSEGIVFVVVELGKFKKKISQLIDLRDFWCYLLKYSGSMSSEECEELKAKGGQMGKEVVDQLWILSKDEALREIAMVEDRQKRDLKAVKETMYEEGLEDGIEKGMEKGRVAGRQEGRQEGYQDVALNLLKIGIDSKVIMNSTGLTEKDIEELKKQLK